MPPLNGGNMKHIEYLAGFFDGEGYVGISRNDTAKAMSLTATVTNDSLPVLKLFEERFGGRYEAPKHYGKKQGKDSWTWLVNGEKAIQFLLAIRDYTTIKQPQIDLALTFPIGSRGKSVTNEIHIKRIAIHEGLKKLKKEIKTGPINGVINKLRRDLLNDDEVNKAIELYLSGMSSRQVSETMNIKPDTIAYWMRQAGVSRNHDEAMRLADRVDAVEKRPEALEAKKMYQEGISISEIARNIDKKPATVNYWLRKMGVIRTLSESQKLRRKQESKILK